jgi:hypothetical protein
MDRRILEIIAERLLFPRWVIAGIFYQVGWRSGREM